MGAGREAMRRVCAVFLDAWNELVWATISAGRKEAEGLELKQGGCRHHVWTSTFELL